jgi:lipopolysaccharide assembly outer membrane protein LptD (OstA)
MTVYSQNYSKRTRTCEQICMHSPISWQVFRAERSNIDRQQAKQGYHISGNIAYTICRRVMWAFMTVYTRIIDGWDNRDMIRAFKHASTNFNRVQFTSLLLLFSHIRMTYSLIWTPLQFSTLYIRPCTGSFKVPPRYLPLIGKCHTKNDNF